MAQLVRASSCTPEKVEGSIPGQGTYLGCSFDPQLGLEQEATDPCFSLTSMFLSLPSSLSKTNEDIFLGEDFFLIKVQLTMIVDKACQLVGLGLVAQPI